MASPSSVVQLIATSVLVGLLWIVVPPLVTQLALFAHEAPSYVTRFQHLRNEYLSVKRQYPEAGTFDSGVSTLGAKIAAGVGGQLVNLPLTAAQVFFDLGIIYVLSTLLVLRQGGAPGKRLCCGSSTHGAAIERAT